ncbi:MAG: histidine kinase [Segetibacter sp.]|nr:histidine kinase [Segetibacter sp.]
MKTQQLLFNNNEWSSTSLSPSFDNGKCQLVIVFGSKDYITIPEITAHIRSSYPNADLVFSSSSGEILSNTVHESVVVTAIEFEKTRVECFETSYKDHQDSYHIGKHLMQKLEADDLCGVFVLSDGTNINGADLVLGLNDLNSKHVPIAGGMAGDGARFEKTFVGLNEVPSEGKIVAVGFYGSSLEIGSGYFGGWDEFGRERTITKSEKNVLFELDGKNALDLYKEYLGPYADQLPGSALHFPFSIRTDSDEFLVRTILAVSEEDQSLTSAGNLPVGSKVRLMKGTFDKLIAGCSVAAEDSLKKNKNKEPELAILVSCVGRKIILHDRTEEEVQAAIDTLGKKTCVTGFYSYGEIAPANSGTSCELHNQVMAITTFSES